MIKKTAEKRGTFERNGEKGKQICSQQSHHQYVFPYFHLITIKINLCTLFVIFTRIMLNDCNMCWVLESMCTHFTYNRFFINFSFANVFRIIFCIYKLLFFILFWWLTLIGFLDKVKNVKKLLQQNVNVTKEMRVHTVKKTICSFDGAY